MYKLLSFIVALQVFSTQAIENNPFKHVIVMVMENHSYDTMLGFMDAPIGSLNEKSNCNTYDGENYCQTKSAPFRTTPDPAHGYPDVSFQLYETSNPPGDETNPPTMAGFAENYANHNGNPADLFKCYSEEQLPILSTLAKTYTTFNNWFSGAPTCTDPNKFFVHAASSGGNLGNCSEWYCAGVYTPPSNANYPINVKTIQNQLQEEGYSWSVHWMDWCEVFAIESMAEELDNFVWDEQLVQLYKNMEQGTLDDYTYIIPRIKDDTYPDPETGAKIYAKAATQHPAEDVRYGEQMIKELYENLRKSDYWNDTLLLITYDEHGGFYDHVVPPMNVTNPNPEIASSYDFAFNRLGVRVPSIAISPWLENTVIDSQMEHASIPKTIHEIFDLQQDYLNKREEESNSIFMNDIILNEMRTDCPMTLPEVPFDNDGLYEPVRKQYNPDEILQGTQENQARLLGTKLVQKGALNILKYKSIIDSIKSDTDAMQFAKEAQVLLGYREQAHLEFKFLHENMRVQRQSKVE